MLRIDNAHTVVLLIVLNVKTNTVAANKSAAFTVPIS